MRSLATVLGSPCLGAAHNYSFDNHDRISLLRCCELKPDRLGLKVSLITANHWLTGYFLMAQRHSVERLKKLLATY
jgi:hypothetical protein